MNRTRSIAVPIMMSVLMPQFANAQTGTGAVRVQVVDSQSRAIVGARVALTDENNKLVRTQVTGGLGEFAFVGLPPTIYRLDFEAVGFKKLTIEHVAAAVDSTVEVPARLEVGDVAQSVSVTAEQEPLQKRRRDTRKHVQWEED